jgi:ABC-type glycerol-3-phosphate transport system substrate-binding protein
MHNKTRSRRQFIQSSLSTLALSGVAIPFIASGCSSKRSSDKEIVLGTTGYAAEAFNKILHDLDFTGQTGLKVKVRIRPTTTNELLTQMISAVQAGTSPYDVLDLEDAAAVSLTRAGWLLPLDELITDEVWKDYTSALLEMTKVWDQKDGETFRIHHNFEISYWWYRKDWFDQKGVDIPRTWDDVKNMGEVFTNKPNGVWATEEALQKNTFLDVYTSWITRQAGGNLYKVDDAFGLALQYIHDLMYKDNVLNPACLQKNYDQQNNDYIANRVAFMRQWPFFYDVAQQHSSWYAPEKVACGLPPVGPGGQSVSTYAAGWGYGIPKTAQHAEGAKTLIKFLIANENASRMVKYSSWFLNARHSVLEASSERSLSKYLKMYMEAGVVTTRPFHRKYTEAVAILENIASGFLTNQYNLDDAVSLAKERMEQL